MSTGAIALVGSGEYLPVMRPVESLLLDAGQARGRERVYVQLATAAGEESEASLNRWRELGAKQAEALGAEVRFIPVFNRDDAHDQAFADMVSGAALIYLSGGDPTHLAQSLVDTAVGNAIVEQWRAGASLAGCSAGAMAMCGQVPHFMQPRRTATPGLAVVPHAQVLPHYDKYFGWMPDRVRSLVAGAMDGVKVIGIDEETALINLLGEWKVMGAGQVHLLSNTPHTLLGEGQTVDF